MFKNVKKIKYKIIKFFFKIKKNIYFFFIINIYVEKMFAYIASRNSNILALPLSPSLDFHHFHYHWKHQSS